MANAPIYKEEWKERLQEQLDEATFWEDVCLVEYTSSRTIHNPYQTNAAAAAYTRGAQYTLNDWTVTNDSTTIDVTRIVSEFIDRADLAQTGFDMQMERAARQGQEIQETVEEIFVGDFASMTPIDNGTLTTGTPDNAGITVTSTNIDDIVRHMKTKIRVGNGQKMASRNGMYIIWDATRFELLEAFAMANGFVQLDSALKNGVDGLSFEYFGISHYSSNKLDSTTDAGVTHSIGGVKKAYHLGILNTTYGDIMVDEKDPNLQSGISIVSRLDMKGKLWNNMIPIVYDIHITT